MNPLIEAINVYDAEPCARTFNEDLSWYLEHGFVYSRPDFFVMGRAVNKSAGYDKITGLHKFVRDESDCWHLHVMAGDIAPLFDIMPWPLPSVSFERGNELRFYKTEDIYRLSVGNQK